MSCLQPELKPTSYIIIYKISHLSARKCLRKIVEITVKCMHEVFQSRCSFLMLSFPYRQIPFGDVLTILVSIFHLFSDERKERESGCALREGRKGVGRLLL